MDWNKVLGSHGRAHFKTREYTKDGVTREINDLDRFIDYDDKYFTEDDKLPF